MCKVQGSKSRNKNQPGVSARLFGTLDIQTLNLALFLVKLLLVQTSNPNNTENLPQAELNQEILLPDLQIPTPDNPPWNNWMAIGMWISSVVFIAVFQNLFLFPYLAKQNLDFVNQAALIEFVKTDPTAILLQVISILPAHICTLLLAWLIVTNFKKYSFRQTLGWEWNDFKIWHAFAIIFFFFVLSFILVRLFGEPANDFTKMLENSRSGVYAIAFLATFTAPLVEEVVYRGILYSSLQRKLGIIWAVVLVTFLFALVHVPQYSKDFIPDFQTVGLLLLLSLTLTMLRVYTKNLLPCIVLHTIFNGIQSLLLVLEPFVRDLTKQSPEQTASIFQFINFLK